MGVILGTLTTKEGRVIPIPQAVEEACPPSAEYRKEEEKRYRGCLRRPLGPAWDSQEIGKPVTRQVALYLVKTENLKRGGIAMEVNEKIYTTKAYALFLALFNNPKVWLNSRRLSEITGVDISSVSVLLRRPIAFLTAEGLLERKDDPHSARGALLMFRGECEKPEEEARLWYAKMVSAGAAAKRVKSKAAAGITHPPTATPKVCSTTRPIQVDTETMEAIVRVPLDKLSQILRLL